MAAQKFFNPSEKNRILNIFDFAHRLGINYYRHFHKDLTIKRYDIKTLAELEDHEIKPGTFAYLCKYIPANQDKTDALRKNYFYRICLQDNYILEALSRGDSFIKFPPLMLYIAVHELVHILRFITHASDFDLPLEERRAEEERVHCLTQSILSPVADHELKLILDCFSNNYQLC